MFSGQEIHILLVIDSDFEHCSWKKKKKISRKAFEISANFELRFFLWKVRESQSENPNKFEKDLKGNDVLKCSRCVGFKPNIFWFVFLSLFIWPWEK